MDRVINRINPTEYYHISLKICNCSNKSINYCLINHENKVIRNDFLLPFKCSYLYTDYGKEYVLNNYKSNAIENSIRIRSINKREINVNYKNGKLEIEEDDNNLNPKIDNNDSKL